MSFVFAGRVEKILIRGIKKNDIFVSFRTRFTKTNIEVKVEYK